MTGNGSNGYRHEALLYDSERRLVDDALPFLLEGIERGEPVVVRLDSGLAAALRTALGSLADHAVFHDADGGPMTVLDEHLDRFESLAAEGADRIRVLGSVPADRARWERWAAYEAATTHLFAPLPVWGLCAYDTRVAHRDVLADVERTHPVIRASDGAVVESRRYLDPARFLAQRNAPPDPLEGRPPDVEMPELVESRALRRAGADLATANGFGSARTEAFVLSLSEIATNAILHGSPPVIARLWGSPHRLVATVEDAGRGPLDPLVGFAAPSPADWSGRGVWMARRLVDRLDVVWSPRGCTFRLLVDALPA